MKKTIIVNLFGGPGCGKSTGAARIFSDLKMLGIDAEYVSEFAKDKVWEKNTKAFDNEFYMIGKQSYKISRCFGQVDVIVTDSPIVLGALYCKDNEPMLKAAAVEQFNHYKSNNVNVVLKRVKAYNPNGRNQTESEAVDLDTKTIQLLEENDIKYSCVEGNEQGYDKVAETIVQLLKEIKKEAK